jgi:hypothetical protein
VTSLKTERLIEMLVADRVARGRPMRSTLAGALALGGVVSLAVFLVAFGVRTDIVEALATWRFDLKVVMVLVGLGLAFDLCIALSRPGVSARAGWRLMPLAALAGAAIAIELATTSGASWGPRLVGSNAMVCLTTIPVLAIAPLALVLAILRTGAPASPALAGAAAGLLAATAGAALYAFHCFDDSPLFVVTWYSLAAIPVVALGAIAGRRVLRW